MRYSKNQINYRPEQREGFESLNIEIDLEQKRLKRLLNEKDEEKRKLQEEYDKLLR